MKQIHMLLLLLTAHFSAIAQSVTNDKEVVNKNAKAETFSPFGSSFLPNFFSNISVSSFLKEGVNGKIEVKGKFKNNWSGGISVNQKIGKNDDAAAPIDLSGITPGTTVQFNLNKMYWHPKDNTKYAKKLEEIEVAYAKKNEIGVVGIALDTVEKYASAEEKREIDTIKREYLKRKCCNGNAEFTLIEIEADSDKVVNSKIYALRKKYASRVQYYTSAYRQLGVREIYNNGTEAEKQAIKKYYRVSIPVYISAKAGFTKTSFNYTTDSILLAASKETFVTPTVSVSLVKLLVKGFDVGGYLALNYNYSESYNAANNLSFSVPFGTTANYYSKDIIFGKPKKQSSNNLGFEWRQNIEVDNDKNSQFANISSGLSVIYSVDRKMLSCSIPLYLIRGTDNDGKSIQGLQGGIKFGYLTSTESGKVSSFKDGFTAQLIITEPLDFLSVLSK